MKKYIIIFLITILFIYQKRDGIHDFFYTPPNYAQAHDVEVIMYGTSWCGWCAKTRALLEKNNITYFEYDIETSREGYEQYIDLGGRGVPVLQIGGKIVKGYNPSRMLKLVKEMEL